MDTISRQDEWAAVVSARSASGQTVKAFCAERGIPAHQYYYWRKKVSSGGEGSGFTELVGLGGGHPLLEVRRGRSQLLLYEPVRLDYVGGLLALLGEG